MSKILRRRTLAALIVLVVVLTSCTWRGPNPTIASIEAATGPFEIATIVVPSSVDGFGGGTIYYPTDAEAGPFGAVAVAPGFTTTQATMSWYGPRLASQGFVIFTIDTNTRNDGPNQRGTQMLAALDHLGEVGSLDDIVDQDRQAVMGWSLGGGGSLYAATQRPELRASIPLAPFHFTKNWSAVAVPTMVIGCENDSTAPVATHAEPFYESLSTSVSKAYVEVDAGNHRCVTTGNGDQAEKTLIARSAISFLKRFVDNDTRYDQFLCPAPAAGGEISEYRSSCPY